MLHRKEDNKLIARYILPSVSAMVVSFAYNVVDGMFVGRGVGENALAAVNITVPFTEIMTGLASMLTTGGATIMAIRKGRGDHGGANHAFLTSATLVLAAGIVLALAGVLFPYEIAGVFGATALLLEETAAYIRWYFTFSIFFTLSILGCAFVRNDGSPGLAFWGMVSGAVANIFLDWLFVFPLRMGIRGAAVASGLGQLISCLLLSVHFIRREGILRFRKFRLEISLIKKVITRGLPEFVIQMSQPITIYCYNRVILAHLGESGLSAFAACTYLLLIVMGVFLGVSQGIQPLLGNSFGEGRHEDVRYFFRSALALNIAVTAALYILFFAVGDKVLFLFIRDAGLIAAAFTALRWYGISFLPASANIVYITYFLSTKNTFRAMIVACSRGIVLNSLCVFFIPAWFGAGAIWYPMIVAETLTVCVAVVVKAKYDIHFSV